jgi:hypothetical protein
MKDECSRAAITYSCGQFIKCREICKIIVETHGEFRGTFRTAGETSKAFSRNRIIVDKGLYGGPTKKT